VGPALAVLGIGLLVLGAVAGWGGGLDLNAPV